MMEVIAAVSAANSAYATIKKAMANGSEISAVLPHVGSVLGAEEKLKKATAKGSVQSVLGKRFSDFDAFAEQEKLRERRIELERWMKLQAPLGTWDRWVKFQAEARKAARQAEREAAARRAEALEIMGVIVLLLTATAVVCGGSYFFLRTKGFL